MAPSKNWDDEDSDSSEDSSPPVIARRSKFDDEKDDGPVHESWEDAAEDSEVEREKAKKAEESRLQKEAEAKANKKTGAERRADRIEENRAKARAAKDAPEHVELTPAQIREREKLQSFEAADDLFNGDIGVSNNRSAVKPVLGSDDPTSAVDLSALSLFKPEKKEDFDFLRDTLVPLIGKHYTNANYHIFLQEFTRELAKDLESKYISKVSSGLTVLSNTKINDAKNKNGGKKSKAAKTKPSVVAHRDVTTRADTSAYEAIDDDEIPGFYI